MNPISAIKRYLNRNRRCVCGALAMPGVGAYRSQLASVVHRVDGPCFVCNPDGSPR